MMNITGKKIFISWLAVALCMPCVCFAQDAADQAKKDVKPQIETKADDSKPKADTEAVADATDSNKPDETTATTSDEERKNVSSAVKALEARLQALEDEEAALSAINDKLNNGEEVTADDLKESWLPPAVYLVDLNEDDPNQELTGEAAGNVREILSDKEDELEQLYALKTEMEGGRDEAPPVLESIAVLGLENPEDVLAEEEKELEAMRAQLQRLRFHDRFQRSADLAEAIDDDQTLLQDVALSADNRKDPILRQDENETETDESPKNIAVNLLKLGQSCYEAGRYEKALEVFTNIDHAAHVEGDRVLYMMGRCSEKIGDLKAARDHYREVGKVYPESFWANEAKFAITMVDWKEEVGEMNGLPPEVLRVLGRDVTINDTMDTEIEND